MIKDHQVEDEARHYLQVMAVSIDEMLNGKRSARPDVKPGEPATGWGFIVAMFRHGDHSRFNYMSNCNRQDIAVLLRKMAARFEGQPEPPRGTA